MPKNKCAVKQITSKTTEISTIGEGDWVISDPTEIADSIKQFFCSVRKDLSDEISKKENPLLTGNYAKRKQDVEKFAFIPVNPENVMKAGKDFRHLMALVQISFFLLRSPSSFSQISVQISAFLLKVDIEVLAPSLAQLFNLFLSTGRFPYRWKIARVALIRKKDPKMTDLISVLSVISRPVCLKNSFLASCTPISIEIK